MSEFITYNVSLEFIRELRNVVAAIKKVDKDLADQLQRAASSVSLNLAEGQRLYGGNQRKHYAIAHASANESRAALDLVEAWGYANDAAAARRTLDRLLALLWRLNHPKQRVDHGTA
jgi:four helix bundle protein